MIDIRIVGEIDPEDVLFLYREAGWLQEKLEPPPEEIRRAFRSSACVVLAYADGQVVGMGRLIGDGVADCYIQDVAVATNWRSRGIGREIVRRLVQEASARGVSWLGLIAEPGMSDWYLSCGFEVMQGYVPMLLAQRVNPEQ